MIGTRLAHYEITSHLGTGGMGEVFQATDGKLGRSVAVKFLPAAFARDEERLARFEREARVLASLNHPNIAAIYGLEEAQDKKFLVMELVPGETLAEKIARGAVPLEEALRIASQIADALEAAHETGVVHRDLKPANVKITREGKVKVLDFGLAKSNEPGSSQAAATNSPTMASIAATNAGIILGTAPYMSPEQASGDPVDRRSDIWSFGVVLWELLTGKLMFQSGSVALILADVLRAPIDFSALPAGTPPAIRSLIERCLEREVRHRLQAMGEARIAIDRWLANPVPVATATPAANRRAPWGYRIASALLATIAIGLGVTHFTERSPVPEVTRFTLSLPVDRTNLFAISPDGREIVAATQAPGERNRLTIRALGTLEPRILPNTEGANDPFWSPDGRYVGFTTDGKVRTISSQGGPPQAIADVSGNFFGATWSASGTILFTSGATLKKVPAAGGTPVEVATGKLPATAPEFLPDGRHFLFTSPSALGGIPGIYLGSVDDQDVESRQPRRILPDVSSVRVTPSVGASNSVSERQYLLFVREGTLMGMAFDLKTLSTVGDVFPIADRIAPGRVNAPGKFSVSASGVLVYETGDARALHYSFYDRQGKPLGPVGKPGAYQSVALSPDGSQLAGETESGGNTDIWLFDLARESNTRLTFGPAEESAPIWSPDGRWIAFSTVSSGTLEVRRKLANGTGPEEVLLKLAGLGQTYDWSPDGKYLLMSISDQGGINPLRDIFALPVEGDRKLIPLVQTPFRDDHGQFSPDGRFFAYKSNESGRDEIYVQPFPPANRSERWMISRDRGTQPRWSRDGKELYYLSGAKLMAVRVQTSPTFKADLPQELFTAPLANTGGRAIGWDVTPDGKRFVMVTEDNAISESPLTVVMNWQAGLLRK